MRNFFVSKVMVIRVFSKTKLDTKTIQETKHLIFSCLYLKKSVVYIS